MSDPQKINEWLDRFGHRDARILAKLIMSSKCIPFSIGHDKTTDGVLRISDTEFDQHDAMEALKRLCDIEMESRVCSALATEGACNVVYQALTGQVTIGYGTGDNAIITMGGTFSESVYSAAILLNKYWPQSLQGMVRSYIRSQDEILD